MRNGHLYKIQGMLKHGISEDEIIQRFRSTYTAEHIRQFLPGEKKIVRKRRATKESIEAPADE